MTGEALLDYVSQKAELDPNTFLGLYEVICDGVLGKTSSWIGAWLINTNTFDLNPY